jgi:hypothetical protein
MIRTSLSALAVLTLLATPAVAAYCPLNAEAIDHALTARADLPEAERAEIQSLRDQGMQEHEAGDHRASEATLAEAMRRLLLAE